jgi:release factor glutamine methyltransferase
VFAEEEAELLMAAASGPADLAARIARRSAGLPLEHVVGWAEFMSLRIAVDEGVFVPRRRTEFLVECGIALGRAQRGPGPLVVVDLCCGSGAIGVALAAHLDAVDLHAADLDPAATACARRNVLPAGGAVHQGDLFAALPGRLRGRIGVLAANVPYVPTGELPLLPAEAREHEALMALDGGADGLDVLRRVVEGAREWLAPGGGLLSEVSERQAPAAAAVVRDGGLEAEVAHDGERGATVVTGRRAA